MQNMTARDPGNMQVHTFTLKKKAQGLLPNCPPILPNCAPFK